jgi:SOS-response transcriptional repressor LexA
VGVAVVQAIGLTHRQQKLLTFIEGYIAERGASPSFAEMAAGAALKSRSGIHRILSSLEERGRIARRPGLSRSVVILKPAVPITVDDLRATVARLIEQEGIEVAAATWHVIGCELAARQGAA